MTITVRSPMMMISIKIHHLHRFNHRHNRHWTQMNLDLLWDRRHLHNNDSIIPFHRLRLIGVDTSAKNEKESATGINAMFPKLRHLRLLNLFHQHLDHVGTTPDNGAYLITVMVMCRPLRHGADRKSKFDAIVEKKKLHVLHRRALSLRWTGEKILR